MTASVSSNSTSAIDARIVTVRSVSTVTSMDGGSDAWRAGRSARDTLDDLDDVRSGLALDVEDDGRASRCTHAASLLFSGANSTVATSESLTGEPFLNATISFS